MSTTPVCSYPRCRRKTKDATGRCQDHRVKGLVTTAPPPPPVTTSRPKFQGGGKRKVETHSDGSARETWGDYRNRFHREDGPAVRSIGPDGSIYLESYYLHGDPHRVDGPSEITYMTDGRVASEHYRLYGQPHRIGGPSSVGYAEDDGSIYGQTYAVHGKYYMTEKKMHDDLRSIGLGPLREKLHDSPYRDLADQVPDPAVILDLIEDGIRSPEGMRAVIDGAPREWARSFEEGQSR